MLAGIPNWDNSSVSNNYLYTGQTYYWTMSPATYFDGVIMLIVYFNINISTAYGYDNAVGIRPVINIRSNVELTGTGSQNDPFKVVGAN